MWDEEYYPDFPTVFDEQPPVYYPDFPTVDDDPWTYSIPDYSTAPSASVQPGVFSTILGSVLDMVVPSAEAAIPGVVTTAARALGIGGTVATAGGIIAGAAGAMSNIVTGAIFKLRQRLFGVTGLTMTAGALAGWGRKIWGQLTAWVQRNPGTSAIAFLTGLGLTVEEAAHFLAWGATHKKKRRRYGITAGSLKTTRRTIRTITSMSRNLAAMCTTVPRRHHHHFKRK